MGLLSKTLVTIILIPVLIVAFYIGYLWITYIDDTVSDGSKYGFTIGDSKEKTYSKAIRNLYAMSSNGFTAPYIRINITKELEEVLATESGHKILAQTRLQEIGFAKFKNLDTWKFYIDGSNFNTLTLKFCANNLCEIYRHRKYFELP